MSYESYQGRRAQLVDLIARSRPAFADLDMTTWAEATEKLEARVESDRFRVMVLGEFKRGKSTFINALQKAEVLPADVAPCTAVINEVKWGESPRARLHFRQPLPERCPTLPAEARRHVDRHRNGPIPPLDIEVGELQDFVRIPDPTADQSASVAESPYDRVELYWPLDLCRNGVEIIDSPGLNEHHTRTKTTRDYLAHIDAVIFVMSVHALAGESELAVIDNDLKPTGHEYLFFVCNRFDELRRREDRDKITTYAYSKLADRTRFGREGLFFLSAFDALMGRLEGDASMIARSGIASLERALERFLVEDRGRIKLLQPAGQLARGLRVALTETIPARRRLLEEDAATLRRKLDEARPQLEQAGRRRDNVLRQVEAARLRVRDAVRREADRFFSDLSHDVPMWAKRMSTDGGVSAIPFGREQQVDRLSREVVAKLVAAIEASLAHWERAQLRPLLDQQMGELTESLNTSVEPFLEYLDMVKARLADGFHSTPSVDVSRLGSLDRLLAGGVGTLVGAGVILATFTNAGAVLATAGLSAVTTAVAAKLGALLLSLANPFTLSAMVIGAMALHRRQGAVLTEQVKLQVAEGVAAQLRNEARDRSNAIAQEVFEQTEPIANAIAEGLERELHQVREQIDAVLRKKEQGMAAVEEQRREVDRLEAVLRSVADDLNDLILSFG